MDTFLTKMSANGSVLMWSTYLGGGVTDHVDDISIDDQNNVVVAGYTDSSDFPILNAYDTTRGGYNAFITKFMFNGSLLWSTFLGDNDVFGYGVTINSRNNVIMTGYVQDTNYYFPVTMGRNSSFGFGEDVFISSVLDPLEDTDGDNLTNIYEFINNLNTTNPDTDGDLMYDGWELQMGLAPLSPSDAQLDKDSDGMTNLWEFQMGLNATNEEDAALDKDTDGMPNLWEYQMGLNASDPFDAQQDPDDDALTNLKEYQLGLNATDADTDNDLLPDGWEYQMGLNATDPQDANLDNDNDQLTNLQEFLLNLNATNPDTDDDGLSDGQEVNIYGTDPLNPDTDDDEFWDGEEVINGTDPLQVTIISSIIPINGTLLQNNSDIVLEIREEIVSTMWYQWDEGNNQSFESNWTISSPLTDGGHWLTIYANDTSNRLEVKRYYFYCDALAPVIGLVGTQNDTVISSTDKILLNVTDFSLRTVWFNWDDSVNQTFGSSYEVATPIPEGYHWLTVYANDSVAHLSSKRYYFYVNYPPVIQLQTLSNNCVILHTTEISLNITDPTLTMVWYQWESEGNIALTAPFLVNASGVGWRRLSITATDSWNKTTTKKYLSYILTPATVETTQAPPATAYDGESFVFSFTITNPESIILNLTLFVYGNDDTVLQGNGSQIVLSPGESKIIELKIKPNHASIHQLLIRLYHGGEVYYQYTLEFNVEPQWMSPRFYIPFIIFPILIILLFAVIVGTSFYFIRTRERIRQVLAEEFTSTKAPVSLAKVQSSIKAPTFMVRMGIATDPNLVITPDGKIVDKEHLIRHIEQITSSSTIPIGLADVSKEYKVSMVKILSIVNKTLSEGKITGKIVANVFYPSKFISQVVTFISNQGSGNLSTLFEEFQTNQQIVDIAVKNLLDSDESIFTVYLYPDQDIFVVIYNSEWNNIVRILSSAEGFTPGTVFPRLKIYNWKSIFWNQKLTVLTYGDQFFTVEGLQAYTSEHLDEINHIILNVRRQLPQLSLTSRGKREILQSFEQLLPIEPVLLPYYCQMDSAMIVKEQSAHVCVDCNRKICPTCYNAMCQTGMANCIHCGGDLVERPALQIEVDIERVDQMTSQEFENFLEGLFRTQMYRVENIQRSGDHGVDLVVVKEETKTGVQAKRFKPSTKIGNKALVTLKGGGYFHDCNKLMVITTSYFTRRAKEFAKKDDLELWDRDNLRRYLTKYNEHLQRED